VTSILPVSNRANRLSFDLEAGVLPHDRVPAVTSDREMAADFDRPLRRIGADADNLVT
jgi:hypothetical protein